MKQPQTVSKHLELTLKWLESELDLISLWICVKVRTVAGQRFCNRFVLSSRGSGITGVVCEQSVGIPCTIFPVQWSSVTPLVDTPLSFRPPNPGPPGPSIPKPSIEPSSPASRGVQSERSQCRSTESTIAYSSAVLHVAANRACGDSLPDIYFHGNMLPSWNFSSCMSFCVTSWIV